MKNKQEKRPISLGLVLLCLFPALYAGNQFSFDPWTGCNCGVKEMQNQYPQGYKKANTFIIQRNADVLVPLLEAGLFYWNGFMMYCKI